MALTPYSFQLFPSAFQTAYSKVLSENFQEMQALAFRRPQHFVLLLLVMAAFLALGRRRSKLAISSGPIGVRDPGSTRTWGGFLTWYLPEYPVSIDGSLNLYGDEINERYFKVTEGTQRLEADPSFTRARSILLERNSALTKALTTLRTPGKQFRVAYQDDLATVLVRQ